MKRLLLFLVTFVSLSSSAQDTMTVVKPTVMVFAYLSYEQALKSMPDYGLVQTTLAKERAKYEAELKRVEQDFNLKYEEFLEGQRDFPQTILRKRQTELKELLERNVSFKAESRQALAESEAKAMVPLKAKLAEVLEKIGLEQGYAFILNTDANAVPFINPALGEDITQKVIHALR
jgi:outer membrane protein